MIIKKFYWGIDSFEPEELPDNWQKMCKDANDKIDAYISENELDPICDEAQIQEFSETLAENWVTLGLYDEVIP